MISALSRQLLVFLVNIPLAVFAQEAEPIAVIQTDGFFSLVRTNGRMEPLPYYILGLEGQKEGLNQAKIVESGQEARTVYLNSEGKIMVEPKLVGKVEGQFSGFKNGYATFQGFDMDKNVPFATLIDKEGQPISSEPFESVSEFGDNDWFFAHSASKHGYFNEKLKEKLNLPDSIYGTPFVNGLAVVTNQNTGGVGVIDEKGRTVLEPNFAEIAIEEEGKGRLIVQDYFGKSFLYDHEGNLLNQLPGIPEGNFSEGLLAVHDGDGYVYVDEDGKTIIEFADALVAYPFKDNMATVNLNGGGYVLIDKKGEVLSAFPYQTMEPFVNGYAYFIDGDRSGYVDTEGNEIELNYEMIWDLRTSEAIF
jgi:hypothetical protein